MKQTDTQAKTLQSVLANLKEQLESSRKNTSCFSDEERNFADGKESGLETAIQELENVVDMHDELVKKLEKLVHCLTSKDGNENINEIKAPEIGLYVNQASELLKQAEQNHK